MQPDLMDDYLDAWNATMGSEGSGLLTMHVTFPDVLNSRYKRGLLSNETGAAQSNQQPTLAFTYNHTNMILSTVCGLDAVYDSFSALHAYVSEQGPIEKRSSGSWIP